MTDAVTLTREARPTTTVDGLELKVFATDLRRAASGGVCRAHNDRRLRLGTYRVVLGPHKRSI